MKQKIATIFGATGFIGRHLIRRLTEKDFRIIVATRSPYLHGYLKPLGDPGQIDLERVNLFDEKTLKVETLIGYLIIDRNTIIRVVDNIVMEEQQEYIPEQIRDSYSPPPMPKLAEPRYTSGSLSRDAAKQYSANCVLVGNISEKKDKQGNYIFTGEVKNIGGRRSDFVKVDFVFRKNWSGNRAS